MTALLERAKLVFSGGEEVPALGIEDPAAAGAEPGELGEQLGELDADPEPGRKTRRRSRAAASKATAAKQTRAGGKFTSKATVQKSMAEEIEAMARFVALTWSVSDEHCAAVLNETSASISRDLAALLARSDYLVEKWQATTLFADVVRLGGSSLPLLRAVWAHHFAGRRQEQEGEDYEPVAVGQPERYAPYQPATTFAG